MAHSRIRGLLVFHESLMQIFFISKKNETLNFFAPLRMMAGPIYHAKKKQPEIDFFAYFYAQFDQKMVFFASFFVAHAKLCFLSSIVSPLNILNQFFFSYYLELVCILFIKSTNISLKTDSLHIFKANEKNVACCAKNIRFLTILKSML